VQLRLALLLRSMQNEPIPLCSRTTSPRARTGSLDNRPMQHASPNS
jgi:hypothetical protein